MRKHKLTFDQRMKWIKFNVWRDFDILDLPYEERIKKIDMKNLHRKITEKEKND